MLISFIILVLFFLFLSGCIGNSDDAERFIGVWEWTNGTEDYEYTFYENGSLYAYYFNHENDDKHEGWGNFEILEGKKVRMYTSHGYGGVYRDETHDYFFYDSYNKLNLSMNNYLLMTLVKKS